MSSHRRPFRLLLSVLAVSGIFGVLAGACGIDYGTASEETELFKKLTVTGDFEPGGPLTMTLDWEQPYPVQVQVRCQLLSAQTPPTATPEGSPVPPEIAASTPTATPPIPRVRPTPRTFLEDIPGDTLARNDAGGPVDEATPTSGVIERRFRAPAAPGKYVVRCFTPGDENNAIFKEFTLASAAPAE